MDIRNEEQPIVATPDGSGDKPEAILEGRVNVDPDNDQVAPLDPSTVKVMVELTGSGSAIHRPGLDLVAVLDISTSMGDDMKLERLKKSMLFLIRKLTPSDRLSIVTFDDNVEIVCGLRAMSDSFRAVIEGKVSALSYRGNTNIADGLRTGLSLLNTRRFNSDRVGAIMLMSDGEQNRGGDATSVRDNIDTVPVFTFGFGTSRGAQVLRDIAKNSREGTFSDVAVLDDLNPSFAQILAGLVTVIVQDLQLTLQAVNSTKIIDVSAGSYAKNPNTENLVTVLFGYLYDKESRKVMVELLLPATTKPGDMKVLEITCTYSVEGQSFPQRFFIYVERTSKPIPREKERVTLEKKRLMATALMREAREMAEKANLNEAKKKLNEAQQLLRGMGDDSIPVIKTIKYELKHLLSSLKTLDMFLQKGLPFALSSELSHERQRFAARGDHEQVRLFSTPRMDEYLQQAKAFDKNPEIPLPTAEEDAKQELAADPLAPIAGAITFHIQSAIQSLQAIANIFSTSR